MNNIEKLFNESKDIEQYARGYFKYLHGLLENLDTGAIADFIKELEEAYQEDKAIFIIGNGGSAATASHMANDLGVDVIKKAKCEKPFRVLALTDNNAAMTAIANDCGYENLFVDQLRIHFRKGDKLIAISASGNSPNIIEAVRWVKKRSGKTIGLTGFDGGEMNGLCDVLIHTQTPKGEYGPVEDSHLILDHLIATWLQFKMRSK